MGSKGGGSTVSQSSSLPPEVSAQYTQALSQAHGVSQTPFQPFNQQLVAGLTPTQQAAMQGVNNTVGYAQPYTDAATAYTAAGANPLADQLQQFSPQAIQQYQNPFTQQVVNSTMGLVNQQNAQQRAQLNSDAIKTGNAFGGDRLGVAQAQLAENQSLTNNQTIAGLYNQSYNQALGEFNNQQASNYGALSADAARYSQAGNQMANLGTVGQANQLQGLQAALGAGTLDQQTQQNLINAQYGQFLRQIQYPFESAQYYTNAAEGIGSLSGGSSSTTYPQPSTGSQVLGGVAGTVGILGQTGAFGSSGWLGGGASGGAGLGGGGVKEGGRILHRAPGGLIPSAASMNVPLVGGGIPGSGGLGDAGGAGPPAKSAISGLGFGSMLGGDKKTQQDTQGQDNTLQTIAQVVAIAAMFLKDGGRIGHKADGGGIPAYASGGNTYDLMPTPSAASFAPGGLGGSGIPGMLPGAGGQAPRAAVQGLGSMLGGDKTTKQDTQGQDTTLQTIATIAEIVAMFLKDGGRVESPDDPQSDDPQRKALSDLGIVPSAAAGAGSAVSHALANPTKPMGHGPPVAPTTPPDALKNGAPSTIDDITKMYQAGKMAGATVMGKKPDDEPDNFAEGGAPASNPFGGAISSALSHLNVGSSPAQPGGIDHALGALFASNGSPGQPASAPSPSDGGVPAWGRPNDNGMPAVGQGGGGFGQLAQWQPPPPISLTQTNAEQAARDAAEAAAHPVDPMIIENANFLKAKRGLREGGPVHLASGGMDRSFISGLAQAYQDQKQSSVPGLDSSGDPLGLGVKRNYDTAGASTPMAPTSPEEASKLGLSNWSGFARGGAPGYDDGGTIFDDITRPSADNMQMLDAISRRKALAAVANDNPHESGLAQAVPQRKAANGEGDWSSRAVHSPWGALAQAGFATMAGTSPYFGVNLGQGMLAGEQALQNIPKYDIMRAQAEGVSAEAEGKRLANFGLKSRMKMYGLDADGETGASPNTGLSGATGLPSQSGAMPPTAGLASGVSGFPAVGGKMGKQSVAVRDPNTGALLDPATLWQQYTIAQMTGDSSGAAAILHVLETMQPQGSVLSEGGLSARPGYYKFRTGEEAAKSAGNTLGWANLGLDRTKAGVDIWKSQLQYDPMGMLGPPPSLSLPSTRAGAAGPPLASNSPPIPEPLAKANITPQTADASGSRGPASASAANPPPQIQNMPGAPPPVSETGQYWNAQDILRASQVGLKGEDILRNMNPYEANEVRQMIDGRAAPPKGVVPNNPQAQMLMRLANVVDPTWDETVWSARNAQRKDLATNGKGGPMTSSIRLAVEHATNALKDISDLDNAGLPQINWLQNKGAGAWGDIKTHSEVGDLNMSLAGLAEEMRRVFANAQGGALEEYKDWQKKLGDTYESKPYAIEMLRHGMLMLLSRTDGLKQQYDYTMDPDGSHPERQLDMDKLMGAKEQHAITTLMRYPIRTKSGDFYWKQHGVDPDKVYENSVYTPLLHPFRSTPNTSPLMDVYHHLRLEPKVSDDQFLKLGEPLNAAPPASALKPGVHTTFANGQTWALDEHNNPVRVK